MNHDKIISVTEQRPFTMVYHDFLKSDVLTPNEKIVFMYLKMHAGQKDSAYPSMTTLSHESKLSKSTIVRCIESMKAKGVISVTKRNSEELGHISNLYTLHDDSRIWGVKKDENGTIDNRLIEEIAMISKLESMGYTVTKKEPTPTTSDQRSIGESSITEFIDSDKNNTNIYGNGQSQDVPAERYSIQDIEDIFDLSIVRADLGEDDADVIQNILYDVLNSRTDTIRIGTEERSAHIVKGRLMKLDYTDIEYALRKYHSQGKRIRNHTAYILKLLYNAKEQHHLEMQNEGHVNGDF